MLQKEKVNLVNYKPNLHNLYIYVSYKTLVFQYVYGMLFPGVHIFQLRDAYSFFPVKFNKRTKNNQSDFLL